MWGFFYLSMAVLYLVGFSKVKWNPAGVGDGLQYMEMVKNLSNAKTVGVSSSASPRILPALLVGITSRALDVSPALCFRFFSVLSFCGFSYVCFFFISKKIRDYLLASAFTIWILISFWPISYSLYNIYQLTDMLSYLTSIGMVWFLLEKRFFPFFLVSMFALGTKQNLWVLSFLGNLFFFLHGFRKEPALSFGITHQKLVVLTGFAIQILSVILLITTMGNTGISAYYEYFPVGIFNLPLYRGRLFLIIKKSFYIFLPFFPILILKWRSVLSESIRHYPISIFIFLTLVVPFGACLRAASHHNFDFYSRLGMQGAYIANIYALILVGRKALSEDHAKWRSVLIFSPILYGTAHLFIMKLAFSPFFILPTFTRHLIFGLFFAMAIHMKERKLAPAIGIV